MLLQDKLADEIVANLNHDVMCMTYLSSIKSYVEANIQILATYTGVTPVGAPDPLSGPIQLTLTVTPSIVLGNNVRAFLSALKEPNPSAFIEAIFTECISDIISGPITHTLSAKAIYKVNNFLESELKELKEASDYRDCWKIVCGPIVRTFLSMVALPATIPTVTSSGTGTTVINKVL